MVSNLGLKAKVISIDIERWKVFPKAREIMACCLLHQVVAQEGQLFALDLPAVDTQKSQWLNASEWRCHFHVPLHWRGSKMLETTASQWRSALNYALEQQLCHHYEIETYTWSVLPEHARGILSITDGISAEFQVVRPFFDGVSS